MILETPPRMIDLGIRGEQVPVGSHVAFFWEKEKEFEESVGFLVAGLKGDDACVVFGHDEANEKVLRHLEARGFDVEALEASGRLMVLGGRKSGDAMLEEIGGAFQEALDRGSPLIRLLGNIGWGREDWPGKKEILRFEARVTGAAASFPCVVVCNYDAASLSGDIVLHGAFETHPLTFCRNLTRENPQYCDVDEFLARLED